MHRLLPRRTAVDAPAVAATMLLRWLSLCLLLCLLGTGGFYLLAQLSDKVSKHRRDMNAAAYTAQLYFDQREALLDYLVDSVVEGAPVLHVASGKSADGKQMKPLLLGNARGGQQLQLPLSEKSAQRLSELGVRLLHVDGNTGFKQWLDDSQHNMAIPPELDSAKLSAHASWQRDQSHVHWLASQRDAATLFLYRPVDDGPRPQHWLVLMLDPIATRRTISGDAVVSSALLDQSGNRIASSGMDQLPDSWLRSHQNDAFGPVWRHGLPDGLALIKGIGRDGWRLVYHLPPQVLLRDLFGHIAATLLLCATAIITLRALTLRIDRLLIQPAHRQHQQLLESFDFSSKVIEVAPVGICVLRRRDGEVEMENQLARDWLGADTRGGDWLNVWRYATNEVSSARASDFTADFSTHDGRPLQVLYAAARYQDQDVVLCVFNDVSEHRQIQAALSAASLAADRASKAKSAFVATLSHEIRTPLYGMLGTLELLANTRLDAKQTQHLHIIQRSSSVLLQLISDTLDIARIESGLLNLSPARFSPLELAESTLRAYADAAARKRLQILVCTDPRLPAWVIGDAGRIRQVLGNLLSNAIKFTDSGRVFLRVGLQGCQDGVASIRWQVSDTGIGIAASEQRHLFKPFQQIEGRADMGGSGLGLAISDHLVRLMHGQMRLVSEPGLGASFTVVLPLPLATNSNQETDAPCLLPSPPVYVRASVPELVESACQWLRRWGATALPHADGIVPHADNAILVDSDPRDAVMVAWRGPRVITAADAGEQPEPDLIHPDRLTVTLFSIRAIAHAVARLQQGQAGAISTPAAPALPALRMRVLVAEDNPINQRLLKEQLEALGCSVCISDNGHEAEAACRHTRFDVVLTDLNMPEQDGLALTRQLRTQGRTLPVIGVTANATPQERARCLAAGMDGVLVKPVDIETLRRTLVGAVMQAPPARIRSDTTQARHGD
ncbi:response regulator [Stenotrophomonas sp. SY1]|uniref:response regulator n=1 Tax=Stenotrophomonas sp. SY1 TaxID=477235 RepID=UPI001E4FD2AB|nr:response regulator [Stenotrophomonas sp. SY1]MCD9086089.1 response regulator [Stenotrophomonas sp. SY1]